MEERVLCNISWDLRDLLGTFEHAAIFSIGSNCSASQTRNDHLPTSCYLKDAGFGLQTVLVLPNPAWGIVLQKPLVPNEESIV